MRGRKYRREQHERMRAKARRLARRYGVPDWCFEKIADNLAFCNRHCCHNPRKQFKQKTLKEKLEDAKFREVKKNL